MDGSVQTIKAKVIKKNYITTPKKKKLIEIACIDENDHKITTRFLNMTYILRSVVVDQRYYIVGVPQFDKGKRTYRHPEFVLTQAPVGEDGAIGGLYPIYPELQ